MGTRTDSGRGIQALLRDLNKSYLDPTIPRLNLNLFLLHSRRESRQSLLVSHCSTLPMTTPLSHLLFPMSIHMQSFPPTFQFSGSLEGSPLVSHTSNARAQSAVAIVALDLNRRPTMQVMVPMGSHLLPGYLFHSRTPLSLPHLSRLIQNFFCTTGGSL